MQQNVNFIDASRIDRRLPVCRHPDLEFKHLQDLVPESDHRPRGHRHAPPAPACNC